MKFVSGLLLVAGLAAVNAVSTGRIVGGNNAPQGSANYHAHLLIRTTQNAAQTHVGSGTLISAQHVLTTATNTHNFGFWSVGLGNLNRGSLEWHDSMRAIAHNEFDATTLNHNLGIIFMNMPIQSTLTIVPATLPSINQMNMPMVNENGRVSGFGFMAATGNFANDLQMSFQRVTDNMECIQAFPHMQSFISSVFCGESSQGSICAGDQGAGFVVDVFFQPTLLGVASFTSQQCNQGSPSVYTRVNAYRNWIQQQTQINF